MTLQELLQHTNLVKADPENREAVLALCDAVVDFYNFGNGYGTVYFAQIGEDGPIKIGFTQGEPLARIAALQTGCPWPIRLLGGVTGDVSDELALHQELAADSLCGEWFDPTPAVKLRVMQRLSPDTGNSVASFQKYRDQLRSKANAGSS